MAEEGVGRDFGWGEARDLTSLSEDDLRAELGRFVAEEREISYRRRVLQGRIDLIRSELVRRGSFGLSHEDLVRVLMEEGGGEQRSSSSGGAEGRTADAPSNEASNEGEAP